MLKQREEPMISIQMDDTEELISNQDVQYI